MVVPTPEFLNYYQGLIRHNHYQKEQDDAVENNQFEFKKCMNNY